MRREKREELSVRIKMKDGRGKERELHAKRRGEERKGEMKNK